MQRGGVLKTDTPLLRNRLYFNILQFTLNEIGSGAGTTAAAAAGFAGGGRGVTKEVRSGEIGFCTRSDFTAFRFFLAKSVHSLVILRFPGRISTCSASPSVRNLLPIPIVLWREV